MKDVYTLSDLNEPGALDSANSKPARLAVIGHPVAHSLSPQMHQAALDEAEIDCRYIRIDLAPDEFAGGIRKLAELGFIGCNVTVPHKEAAFAIADRHDQAARELGVCNTLVFEEDGIKGLSTDGPGFAQAILEEFHLPVSSLKIMILGAGGGAGRSIATFCASEGCDQLILVNRSIDKVRALAAQLRPMLNDEYHLAGPSDRLIACGFDDPRLPELIEQTELIVNASSLGLKSGDPSPIPGKYLEPQHLVYDTIYHSTQLQKDALQRGARLATGQSMLLHQGALSFEDWLHQAPSIEAMRRGLKAQ